MINDQLKVEWTNLIKISEICKNISNVLTHMPYLFFYSPALRESQPVVVFYLDDSRIIVKFAVAMTNYDRS